MRSIDRRTLTSLLALAACGGSVATETAGGDGGADSGAQDAVVDRADADTADAPDAISNDACGHVPVVVHASAQARWTVWDDCAYAQGKPHIDELSAMFDGAVALVLQDLGVSVPLPVDVRIEAGGCCGGWASGGKIGFAIGDFDPAQVMCSSPRTFDAFEWTRGVIIGEFVNYSTGEGVSGGWPTDWWVDHVWYFPAMVVVQVLAQVSGAATADAWEQDAVGCPEVGYPSLPVYAAFKSLRTSYGWPAYQRAFADARADKMDWTALGANPSALLTNYVLAYLSLGAATNVASSFAAAGVAGADAPTVQAIEDVRQRLASCGAANQAAAWTAYRSGDYVTAGQLCP